MPITINKNSLVNSLKMRPVVLIRAAALTLFIAGLGWANLSYASVLDIRFDQDQRYAMKETLAVGKSLELCGLLKNQSQIAWRFESDTKLDFNIHFHVGDAVQYPTKLKQSKKASSQLDVGQEQTYCWMWTNRSARPAYLSANLEKMK